MTIYRSTKIIFIVIICNHSRICLISDCYINFQSTKLGKRMFRKFLPYCAAGRVVKGFGRGSKSLGIPTANLPEDIVDALPSEFGTGIYYGWASVEENIYKMVMSIGWNPFYKNEKKSMEVHLLHDFDDDFYDKELKIIIVGYIRPEKDFLSVDELISEIKNDIAIAKEKLDEPKMREYKSHSFLIY